MVALVKYADKPGFFQKETLPLNSFCGTIHALSSFKPLKDITPDDLGEKLSSCEGLWTGAINFDGKLLFDI
jgi:hypothetical protein